MCLGQKGQVDRTLRIKVLVKTESKQARVEIIDGANFVVYVDEKAVAGKANKRLIEILSDKFGVPKSRISIVRGAKSREKIIELGYEG
jgi:uncharacterized protein